VGGATITLLPMGLKPGAYKVTWHSVGHDTHRTAAVSASRSSLIGLAGARGLYFAAVMLAVRSSVFRALQKKRLSIVAPAPCRAQPC